MGDFNVRPIGGKADRHKMYEYALNDIEAFEQMWKQGLLDQGPIKVGAEQELCIVDKYNRPSNKALTLLEKIDDHHYTNELGLYNLEINLDPEKLEKNCFSKIENNLIHLIQAGQNEAHKLGEQILMTGILPTLTVKHLDFNYMTPIPRYKTLSQVLHNIRGGKFEIYLQGVDDLMASLGSVLFEACNTSFQLHLQIKPKEFVDRYNWSQMIAGPVLSACVNSPLLLGRELWAESRIALFKQSLDTRSSKNHLRKKLPRVYFGSNWLKESPANLWRKEIMRFPLILTSDQLKDSMSQLEQGITPDLKAIRLHNGTTYTWNRLCYGHNGKAHIRIECRYLPAGPSIVDEMANFAFWVGLMYAMPEEWNELKDTVSFKSVKGNFIRAARNGLNCGFHWYGAHTSAKELILETLLPMASSGLKKCNLLESDIEKYLGIIKTRVDTGQNGADWMIREYRTLLKEKNSYNARKELVNQMTTYQQANIPVHEWGQNKTSVSMHSAVEDEQTSTVEEIMSTDVFAVHEEASLSLVASIMKWRKIHHIPVENYEGDLVGIITDGAVQKANQSERPMCYAGDIMRREVISVERDLTIAALRTLLKDTGLKGVPVTRNNRLIGIVTTNDLPESSPVS